VQHYILCTESFDISNRPEYSTVTLVTVTYDIIETFTNKITECALYQSNTQCQL